jgi:hypothetical protein
MMEVCEAVLVRHGEPGLGKLMAQYLSGMAHGVAGSLSQLLEEFPDPLERNRAMGAPDSAFPR